MSEPLRGLRVLVVEDEYLLAIDMRAALEDIGALVLGPVGHLDDAIELINAEPHIDGAVLDVNLGGDEVFDAADLLSRRGVPFLFTTGYDASSIPLRYGEVARCEKPLDFEIVVDALRKILLQQ